MGGEVGGCGGEGVFGVEVEVEGVDVGGHPGQKGFGGGHEIF